MTPERLKQQLTEHISGEISVTGDGRHFEATIISPVFNNLSRLQRHRHVYACLGADMNAIHALSLKTYTPEEAHSGTPQR